jgi:hypothetical protein
MRKENGEEHPNKKNLEVPITVIKIAVVTQILRTS